MTAPARAAVAAAGLALAVLFAVIVVRVLELGPGSLGSRYRADAAAALATALDAPAPGPVTEADLDRLPAQVRVYLRRAGVVGKPHVRSLRAVFDARFRTARDAPWMSAHVEQVETFGPGGPRRLFFMKASRWGIPFVGYHRYVGDAATMQIRLLGLVPVVDARGPQMTEGETVTLLNDLCVLAPAALVDAPIAWETLNLREVRGTFTNAGHTVSAVLTFDAAGDLVGFLSEDRYQSDGKTYARYPWSTPLSDYRDFGGVRLAAQGDARWREPDGEWTYGHFTLRRIVYDEDRLE